MDNLYTPLLKLDSDEFKKLVANAQHQINYCAPGIYEDQAVAIIDARAKNKLLNVHVIIQLSEDAIRNGFGSEAAIGLLLDNGVTVLHVNDNFISFLIIDDHGYFIFPFSKILIDEKVVKYNAIKMDPLSMRVILQLFVKSPSEPAQSDQVKLNQLRSEWEKQITEAGERPRPVVVDFNHEKFKRIKENLIANPPLKPDIKRMLEVYTTKFQYVELKAKNIKISQHTAHLPEEAIPIRNQDLRKRLSATLKAFENIERSLNMPELWKLEQDIKALRKKYLLPIQCRNGKNLIKKEKLIAFKQEVKNLNNRFQEFSKKLKEVLESEIVKTKKQLKEEWRVIIKQFPPEELKVMKKNSEEFKNALEFILERMESEIDFPDVEKLISEFSLYAFYSELTWNDLQDENLLTELAKKGFINKNEREQIADFKKTLETKKESDRKSKSLFDQLSID